MKAFLYNDKAKKLILLLILLWLGFRIVALNTYGFWIDEARQFWIAKGITPSYNGPLDFIHQDTQLKSLLYNTSRWLLGSPLFTLIIHYWSKISNSTLWLRLIPLLFNLGAIYLMYFMAKVCGFSKKWRIAFVLFCALNATWFYYSIELRSYSLEIFCSALTLLLLLKIIKAKGKRDKYYLWMLLSFLLGLSSGYGYGIFFPFTVAVLVIHTIKSKVDSASVKILKTALLLTPLIIAALYVVSIFNIHIFSRGLEFKDIFTKYSFTNYLFYLKYTFHHSLKYYSLEIMSFLPSMISWQLFNAGRIYLIIPQFSLGSPLLIIAGGVLIYSFLALGVFIRRKDTLNSVVLGVMLYSITACVVLSTLGIYPVGPLRHNLFISPVLFTSFFIVVKHFYTCIVTKRDKRKENKFLILLMVFLLLPNIYRTGRILLYGQNMESMRGLLKRIQKETTAGDKVSLVMNRRSFLVFEHERRFSAIPWIKKVKNEDISFDWLAKTGVEPGYDYAWYIISERRWRRKLKKIKAQFEKRADINVEKFYSGPPGIWAMKLKKR